MHTHHFIFLCTHPILNLHAYTQPPMHTHPYAYTQLPYAYTQFAYLCIHPTTICINYTPICINTHMHTHHTICTHISSEPTESPTVIRCAMRPAACWQLLLYSVTLFSLFLYLGLNKENVCPMCTCGVCMCVCVYACMWCVCACVYSMCDACTQVICTVRSVRGY